MNNTIESMQTPQQVKGKLIERKKVIDEQIRRTKLELEKRKKENEKHQAEERKIREKEAWWRLKKLWH